MRRMSGSVRIDRRGRVTSGIRHLRSPESGNLGQLVRFASVGALVFAIYVAITTLLADVVGLPFEVALVIGFALALVTHFSLQRLFVWVHHTEFVLPFHVQAARYLAIAGLQYGTTAVVTALLPRLLHVSPTAVYIPWVVCVSALNFVVLRHRVFHSAGHGSPGTT